MYPMEIILDYCIKMYYYIISLFDKPIIKFDNSKLKGKNIFDQTNTNLIEKRIANVLETYGSIYYIYDGYQRIVIIGNYHAAKEYYKSFNNSSRKYPYLGYVVEKLLNKSIGVNYGQNWLQMKKPLSQFFTTKSVENNFNMIVDKTKSWLDKTFLLDENVMMINELCLDKLTISILSTIIYGNLSDAELKELHELSILHNKIMMIMGQDMLLRVPIIYNCINTSNKRLVDLFWLKWKNFNRNQKEKVTSNTLLDAMLKSNSYTDETTLIHTLYEIMLFNLDIMTDSFANLVWNIALYEGIRKKIYNESNQINIINYEQIDNLNYIRCVINESARLNPGIVLTFSETITNEEIIIGGYSLPKNTLVSLDTQMINRDPSIWSRPDEFNPDRFSSSEDSDLIFKYHRFGLGPRKCLGNIFADYILKIGILLLIQKFDFNSINNSLSNSKRNTIPNLSNFNVDNQVKFIRR